MSSTRHAKDDSVFHQARYASSPEFEYGLNANLVAKRCTVITKRPDRELIWFVHYLSHQPGGLAEFSRTLIAKFPYRLGTASMVATGKTTGLYEADEVRKIRAEIPSALRGEFRMRGEQAWGQAARIARACKHAQLLRGDDGDARKAYQNKLDAEAQAFPDAYPVERFQSICLEAASQISADKEDAPNLEKTLAILCLDPACKLDAGPWYFFDLMNVIREYQRIWIKEKSNVVVTTLGQQVYDTLDYTLDSGLLSLVIGESALGKTFAAKAWCDQHPGQARFVEVPASNDEASFYRAIANALGLGNFLNYKNVQIRERIEVVLKSGDILLVLNQAQRLWPQKNLREAFPGRLLWVVTQADEGVPICMISGPQFFMAQKSCEKTGWYSPELKKKISNIVALPTELSLEDLTNICRVMLQGVDEDILESLAVCAKASTRYLATVEALIKRAVYIAKGKDRSSCISSDFSEALRFVNASDALLKQPLEYTRQIRTNKPVLAASPMASRSLDQPVRETRPATPLGVKAGPRIDTMEINQG